MNTAAERNPQTEAGQTLVAEGEVGAIHTTFGSLRHAVLAIEAEATSPAALDVERLTLAMCRAFHGEDCAVTQYDAEQADQVAAEYARLFRSAGEQE